MVLYCTVPEKGGHTNFRNAGVHVKPKAGNGIFFSYIDPETLLMDNGKKLELTVMFYAVI